MKQGDVGRRVPPAKGLKTLTWYQIEELDRHLTEICQAGDGQIVIEVKRGMLRNLIPAPILEFRPTPS